MPQLSAELIEWRNRLQRILDLPDLRSLPHPYAKTVEAIQRRYHDADPDRLSYVANEYGARYILSDHPFGEAWESRRVEMNGNRSWFLYDLSRKKEDGGERN